MNTSRVAMRGLPIAGIVAIALLFAYHPSSTPVSTSAAQLRISLSHQDAESVTLSSVRNGKEGPIQSAAAFQQFQRAFPGVTVPPDGYPNGIRTADQMARLSSIAPWKDLGPNYTPGAGSKNPQTGKSFPISGRSTGIAVVPSTCSNGVCGTMYLGTADGGAWKTTDAGKTWTPLLDHAQTQAVGAIVLDPKNPNIIYVGTGEPNLSGDSARGIGILRSLDGGRTWTNIGYKQFVNRAVSAIVIDPRTAGTANATIYAISTRAVSGGAMTGGGVRYLVPNLPGLGFYASKNGGKTWSHTNPATDGAQSLVMDPSDPNVLYAGFVPDVNDPSHQGSAKGLYGFNGVFKSTDDGANWTKLVTGLPQEYFDGIQVAISDSNPKILYAAYSVTAQDSPFNVGGTGPDSSLQLYKSTDAGDSWTQLSNMPNMCISCYYDMPITVDPTNPDIVYVGGTGNYGYLFGNSPQCETLSPLAKDCDATVVKTTDGGVTWSDIGENGASGPVHPDNHVIALSPNDPSVIYMVTDGGIFHSADGGKSWNDLNRGLGTLQFNGLSVSSTGAIYAGTQDNGTFKYDGKGTWTHILGGDGGPTAVDPKNPNIVYESNFGPSLNRNDHAGAVTREVFIGDIFYGDFLIRGLGQFYEPYQIAPSRPNTIYYGTYRLWRSNMRGGVDKNNDGDATNDPGETDWVPISFDFRCNAQPVNPASTCNGPPIVGGTTYGRGIASIAVSPVNPNVVVVGASDGNIWATNNALATVKLDTSCNFSNVLTLPLCDYVSGPSWHRIDQGLPRRYPTAIKFAPGSSTKLYVTFSGFDKNTPGHTGHVFTSDNAGHTWRNISGTGARTTLPDLPLSDIIINPFNGHLYVGADYGIFASLDGGNSWARIDQTLPAAPIHQMQFYAPKHELIVATHGRGIWELVAP